MDDLFVGTRVRFHERYRAEQVYPAVRWVPAGVVVDMEMRPTRLGGSQSWIRARFGDFITPWIEARRFERAD
jgi:hypothetical protein